MATPFLERAFGLAQRGTTVGREALAGATTFVTMAYVLFVNPQILSAVADRTGHTPSQAALLTSTALVAAASTLAMGLLANVPLALAAGMGLNSVVAFQLVAGRGLTWPEAMGVIVAEGLVITLLVLTGLRQAVVRAVPASLKRAIGIGIGLLLAFIGLVNAGFVTRASSGPVPVQLGDGGLHGFPPVLFAFTLLFTGWLLARRTTGALLLGIAAATALSIVARLAGAPGLPPEAAALPRSPIALPDFGQLGQFDLGFVRQVGWLAAALLVFSLMLSDFFDTVGTVVAVGHEAKYLDARGEFPRPGRVLLVDSLAAVAGGASGSSSATTYIESAAGAAAGGRTGLASVVTAALFALSLFLAPLAQVVPPQATGAVLVLVGFLMVRDIGELPWSDPTEAIPAFLTFTLMPFTYSITNGIGAGFISYCVLKTLRGSGRTLHPLLVGAAAAFVVHFVLG
ncbi:MAG TPA: NCS2 family permease [Anaeromyxobacter sp.]|nr:NCS2 family permease [Anaeromyxobacter sp.]